VTMTKDENSSKRNVADYKVIKSDLYDAYRQLIELKNAYVDKDVKTSKHKQRYERGLRRALDVIDQVGTPSRNIDEDTAELVRETRKLFVPDEVTDEEYSAEWSEKAQALESTCDAVSDSMGQTGYLDTRLDEDQVVNNEDKDIPDMFK